MHDDPHLAGLISLFAAAGNRYIAQSFAEALKSIQTAEGSTAGELAETAAAKSDWDAAEKALTEYQLSKT